jgi:hypothetical protein
MFSIVDNVGRTLVVWEDGEISGDTAAVAAVLAAVGDVAAAVV